MSGRSLFVIPGETGETAQTVEIADRPITLWTGGIDMPLRYDNPDGRLNAGDEGDQIYGQEGWDVCFNFSNMADLAVKIGGGYKLPKFAGGGHIEENQIVWLAIAVHGAPGAMDIDATQGADSDTLAASTDPDMLNVGSIPRYSPAFDLILRSLAPRAKVFLMCCRTGSMDAGKAFVLALSERFAEKEVWVVAYKSILYGSPVRQARDGHDPNECYPGLRDTHWDHHKATAVRDTEKDEVWKDLSALPWASTTSPHAIIAFKGVLLRDCPEPDSPLDYQQGQGPDKPR